MQAAAGRSRTRSALSHTCIPLPRRAALPSGEVLLVLQPQPRASKALEGEFPIGAALQPLGRPGAGGPSGRATAPWETALPTASQGDFIPNTLFSLLIQTAFRKRKHFSALIISPESGYCLVSSCCHLNSVCHGERTEQSRFVPWDSPVHTRVSCPLPALAAARHSIASPLRHTAKPGGCPWCPHSAGMFGFAHLCQITPTHGSG